MTDDNWTYKLPKGYTIGLDKMKDLMIDLEKMKDLINFKYMPIKYNIPTTEGRYEIRMDLVGCSHEWVNVGFHFDKFVCKKCNKDKE